MTSWPWMKGVDEGLTSSPIDPVTKDDVRPLVSDLIAEHREKIDKIKAEVSMDPLYDEDKHDDLWLMRFWMSHKKSNLAIKAAKATLLLRSKHKLDEKDVRSIPPHKLTEGPAGTYFQINKHSHRYTLPDPKRGVVGFICIATTDYSKMLDNLTAEDWVAPYMYLSEWTHQWCDYVTRTTGRLTKTIRLLDIRNVGLGTIPRECIKRDGESTKIMEDAYPQMLETLFLCFPGSIFHILWAITRPLLPKRIVHKMDVIDPVKNDKERTRAHAHMQEKHIPKEFGGPNKSFLEWEDIVVA